MGFFCYAFLVLRFRRLVNHETIGFCTFIAFVRSRKSSVCHKSQDTLMCLHQDFHIFQVHNSQEFYLMDVNHSYSLGHFNVKFYRQKKFVPESLTWYFEQNNVPTRCPNFIRSL